MKKELEECFDNIKEYLAEQVGESACNDVFNNIKNSIKSMLIEHIQLNESDVNVETEYNYHDRSLKTSIQIPGYGAVYTLGNFCIEEPKEWEI